MVNQQLLDYIKQQLQQGINNEQIKQSLLANGWQPQDIEESFNILNTSPFIEQSANLLINAKNKTLKIIMISLVSVLFISSGIYFVNQKFFKSEETIPPVQETSEKKIPLAQETQRAGILVSCGKIEISLPAKWREFQPLSPGSLKTKLDENGCHMDDSGCLCTRKDLNSQNVLFSVLITVYPFTDSLSLKDFLKNAIPNFDRALEVENFELLGIPAVKFITISSNRKLGNIYFLKNPDIHALSISAEDSTFSELWPDFVNNVKNMRLQ